MINFISFLNLCVKTLNNTYCETDGVIHSLKLVMQQQGKSRVCKQKMKNILVKKTCN